MHIFHNSSWLKANRGVSCDVISSQFCKSSYSRLPCWFPLSMVRYRKTQQNVPLLLFIYFIPQYQNYIEWQVTNTLGGNFKSFCEINQKFKRFLLFFSILRNTKRKPSDGAKSCVYKCVSHIVNPLYTPVLSPSSLCSLCLGVKVPVIDLWSRSIIRYVHKSIVCVYIFTLSWFWTCSLHKFAVFHIDLQVHKNIHSFFFFFFRQLLWPGEGEK